MGRQLFSLLLESRQPQSQSGQQSGKELALGIKSIEDYREQRQRQLETFRMQVQANREHDRKLREYRLRENSSKVRHLQQVWHKGENRKLTLERTKKRDA